MTIIQSADLALVRGLPASPELERFVLGAFMRDPAAFESVRFALEVDDLSLEKHRRIYAAMGAVHGRGDRIDRVTVATELQKCGQLESVDGITYIASLDDGLPDLVSVDSYVRMITEKSALRRIIFTAQALIDRCIMEQDSPGELLLQAERTMRDLGARTGSKGNLASAAEIVGAMDVNELGRAPRNVLGTPYEALNRNIAGFREGELVVIGARPSAGKTVMAIEIAVAAAKAHHPVAFFSLEMNKAAVVTRAACNQGSVDANALRFGRLDKEQRLDFSRALSALTALPWYIDDRAHTFAEIVKAVRRMPVHPRLVVVDHLHLMRGSGHSENRNNELAQITRDLKLFAGDAGCTVLLLAQLSRASEKENRTPEMRDLRDCGSIEADADIILFLHRKQETTSESEKGKPVAVDVRIAKQRDGQAFIKLPMMLIGNQYRLVETA